MLGVLFLLTRGAELNKVLEVLQRGNLVFLGIAVLVEGVWIYNLGTFFQSVYKALGIQEKRLYMIRLVSAAYFLSVAAPSAGLSAMAVYIADAQRRGQSTAKVTMASIIYIWFEYVGALLMILFGFSVMASRNILHWPEITAGLVLVAGALGLGSLLYMGMQSAASLGRALAWIARGINRLMRPFIHRAYISETRAFSFSSEAAEGLTTLRENPRWIFRPLLFTISNKALLVIILGCCFLAFRVPVDAGTLISGQSLAHLFLIVSPTPAGIGFVEGILSVSLKSFGLPLGDATVVTISYRGFSFWLPFFFGMLMFRMLGSTSSRVRGKAPASGIPLELPANSVIPADVKVVSSENVISGER